MVLSRKEEQIKTINTKDEIFKFQISNLNSTVARIKYFKAKMKKIPSALTIEVQILSMRIDRKTVT